MSTRTENKPSRPLDVILWTLTLLVCVLSLHTLPPFNGVCLSLGCVVGVYVVTVLFPNLQRTLRESR